MDSTHHSLTAPHNSCIYCRVLELSFCLFSQQLDADIIEQCSLLWNLNEQLSSEDRRRLLQVSAAVVAFIMNRWQYRHYNVRKQERNIDDVVFFVRMHLTRGLIRHCCPSCLTSCPGSNRCSQYQTSNRYCTL